MVIGKRFAFEAAHWLPFVPEGHKCQRTHGHSYTVEIEVQGELTAEGWVRDFHDLEWAWARLRDVLDHRCLNDVIPNPTAENVATWIAENLREVHDSRLFVGLCKVTVRETATSWATWTAGG